MTSLWVSSLYVDTACMHAGSYAISLTNHIAGSYMLLPTNEHLADVQFLVIWRFFRMWALADGVQVPENMMRCICNNCDIEVSGLQSRTNVHPVSTLDLPKSHVYMFDIALYDKGWMMCCDLVSQTGSLCGQRLRTG